MQWAVWVTLGKRALFTVHCTINNLTHTKSPMQCTVWVTQVQSSADNPAIALHFRINPISLALTTTLDCNSLSCTVVWFAIWAGRNQDMPGSRANKQIKQAPFVEHLINQPMGWRQSENCWKGDSEADDGALRKKVKSNTTAKWVTGRRWCSEKKTDQCIAMQQTVSPKSRKNQEIVCRQFWH